MNVLLLEDEPELSAVACEQIESRGHKVFAALSIAQAKELIEDYSVEIDILIADQLVPDGNGTQFALATKDMPHGIQVVVVSGEEVRTPLLRMMYIGSSGPWDGTRLALRRRVWTTLPSSDQTARSVVHSNP